MRYLFIVLILWSFLGIAHAGSKSFEWDAGVCTAPGGCTSVAAYRIYRQVSCQGTFAPLTPYIVVPTQQFTDNDVWPGMTYCYHVVAVSATGEESGASNTLIFQMSQALGELPVPINLRTHP